MHSVAEAPASAATGSERAKQRAGIASIATALPPRVVANELIGERLGVDADWISSRTGVLERRVAASA